MKSFLLCRSYGCDIMRILISEVTPMCGRYWIAPKEDNLEYAELLRILGHSDASLPLPTGMIVPTLPAPVITQCGLQLMRFGMKKSFLPKILINARSESVTEKPMFKHLFGQGKRCLLPAAAFYEPSPDKQGRKFLKADGGLLYMAGLFDDSEGPAQFVIMTRDADEVVSPSHHRMPLLINKEELRQIWLHDETLAAALLLLDTDAGLVEAPVA